MIKKIFYLLLIICLMIFVCTCRKDNKEKTEDVTPSSKASFSEKVDVDLTVLSSTMVYSEVYNMLYFYPEDYYGKKVKMTGTFNTYRWVDEEGVILDLPISYACVISDATLCCAEGIEFELDESLSYPDDYPELGTKITVIGEFQPYKDGTIEWYHLVNAKIL